MTKIKFFTENYLMIYKRECKICVQYVFKTVYNVVKKKALILSQPH